MHWSYIFPALSHRYKEVRYHKCQESIGDSYQCMAAHGSPAGTGQPEWLTLIYHFMSYFIAYNPQCQTYQLHAHSSQAMNILKLNCNIAWVETKLLSHCDDSPIKMTRFDQRPFNQCSSLTCYGHFPVGLDTGECQEGMGVFQNKDNFYRWKDSYHKDQVVVRIQSTLDLKVHETITPLCPSHTLYT